MRDPDRLKREVVGVEALRDREPWLLGATPRLHKGLKFAFDFDLAINGETFSLTLEYPAFFPNAPPVVIPREALRLSEHQYGAGGELCLEFRSDNWDPAVTGAMMIESAHRLIAGERPSREERAVVPSAHHASLGQQLRGSHCRFLLTRGCLEQLKILPAGGFCRGRVVEIAASNTTWVAYVAALDPADAPAWEEPGIPDRGEKGEPAIVLRVENMDEVPAQPDQEALDQYIARAAGRGALPRPETGAARFTILADTQSARMFYSFFKEGGATVIPYRTADVTQDLGGRLPDTYAVLAQKKVGLIGCGSLGSKIAASLARSGVGGFTLVDDDILKPGNLARHELDARGVGAHKADALEARLRAIRRGVEVSARRVALGGQESAGSTTWVLDELSGCDLLIDASANPQAFNFVASAARAALRPMLWAEVYAGGIGGFVGRLQPGVDPHPHAARQQYLAWCRQQGVPWLGEYRDYGARQREELPLIADDGDVSVIAAHASRMAIDLLVRPGASIFPHSGYVIGLSKGWIFEQPFDTRPLAFTPSDEWRSELSPERTEEALDLVSSLFKQGEDADRSGT